MTAAGGPVQAALRFSAVCIASIAVSAVALWTGIAVLNWVSIARHGGTGAGGGWSIAIASLMLAVVLGVSLIVATLVAQVRGSNNWPISRIHTYSFAGWLVLLLVFAGLLDF